MKIKSVLVLIAVTMTVLSMTSLAISGMQTPGVARAQFLPYSSAVPGNAIIYANGSVNNGSIIHENANGTYSLLHSIDGNLFVDGVSTTIFAGGNSVNGASGIFVNGSASLVLNGFGMNNGTSSAYLTTHYAGIVTVVNSKVGSTTASKVNVYGSNLNEFNFINDKLSYVDFSSSLVKSITFEKVSFFYFSANIEEFGSVSVENSTVNRNYLSILADYGNSFSFANNSGISLGGTNYLIDLYSVNQISLKNSNITDGAAGSQGSLYIYQGLNVHISDVIFQNFSSAYIETINNVTIDHSRFQNMTSNNFNIWYCKNVTVENSNFTSLNHEGLYIWQGTSISVTNSTLAGSYALDIEDVVHIIVSGNRMYGFPSNGIAFYTYEILSGSVTNNYIYAPGSGYGMYIDEHSHYTASNNHIFSTGNSNGGTGIYIEYVDGMNVTNNYVSGYDSMSNFSYGLYLNYVVASTLSGNTLNGSVAHGTSGIYDYEGTTNSFSNNIVSGFYYSVYIEYTSGDSFINTTGTGANYGTYSYLSNGNYFGGGHYTITNPGGDGMYVYDGSGNVFFNDSFYSSTVSSAAYITDSASTAILSSTFVGFSGTGLDLVSTIGTTVSDSVFQYGHTAVYIQSSNNLLLDGNTFAHFNVSLDLAGTISNGLIVHNNFLNYINASIEESGLLMYNLSLDGGITVGGNYWSNFTGPFYNGVGMLPYSIGKNLSDNYALENPWTAPKITFIAVGLSPGTTWSLTMGGITYKSSTPVISVPIENGSYSYYYYSLGNLPGYYMNLHSGTVYYTGSSISIFVTFTHVTYSVGISETGLSPGTSATITIANATYSLSGTLGLTLANGTYSYSVTSPAGFTTTPTGTFTVSGAPVSLNIVFSKIMGASYTVTFVQTGLIGNYSWSVTIGNNTVTSTSNTITFSLVSGEYNYTVNGPSGYSHSGVTSLNVTGSQTVVVQFSTGSNSGSGASSSTVAAAVGGGLVAGIILTLFVAYGVPAIREYLNKGKEE